MNAGGTAVRSTVAAFPEPSAARRRTDQLAGTGALLRLALRRDRIRLPCWLLGLLLAVAATAAQLDATYTESADRAALTRTLDSAAGLALTGPGHYLEAYHLGAMLAHQLLGMTGFVAGLFTVLTVVRHTRAEEEAGRAELLRSTAVGRHAPLTAAFALAAGASVLLGLLLAGAAFSFRGAGSGVTLSGALLFGAAHTALGLLFAAVAGLAAQCAGFARGASGWALAALGAAYAVRAVGDVGERGLSWASPIGWVQRSYPFVDDRWWPLLPALSATLVLGASAYLVAAQRDLGAGLFAPRTGRRDAGAALAHPVGLALRLHRGVLLGYATAVTLLGAVYGAFLGDASELARLDEVGRALDGYAESRITDAFAAMVLIVPLVTAGLYVALAAQRPATEERLGRAEPLLAGGLTRVRWAVGHHVVVAAGGTVLAALAGLGFGATGALSTGDAGTLVELTLAGLAYAPALWCVAGVGCLLHGLAPRAVGLVWAVPAYAFVVGYLGEILDFPAWLQRLSPFAHVPQLPADPFTLTPLFALTAVALALFLAGLAGFRRRDLRMTG